MAEKGVIAVLLPAAAFSLMMGFQQVWDFDRRQAELDEASVSPRAESRKP